MSYRVINGKVYPVGKFPDSTLQKNNLNNQKKNVDNFSSFLKKELSNKEDFNISNHAAERLKSRNINFSKEDMDKIAGAISKASDKGSKDSVILYKDIALVTSIKNRTIITAMSKEESKENIFTNIDSVVLL